MKGGEWQNGTKVKVKMGCVHEREEEKKCPSMFVTHYPLFVKKIFEDYVGLVNNCGLRIFIIENV